MKVECAKRKQPGDVPGQPTPSSVNVISNIVVAPAKGQPQETGVGCGGDHQVIGPPLSTPPVITITDDDFEPLNSQYIELLEELERAAKCPKLDCTPSGSQTTSAPGGGASNLGDEDGKENHDLGFSIPEVPPLLSPLPPSPTRTQARSGPPKPVKVTLKLPPTYKEYKNKKGGSKKTSTSLLRGVLEDQARKREQLKKGHHQNGDSEFDCFSQSEERDVLEEAAKIYRREKEVVARETKVVEDIAAEIQKTKEKLARLEEKMNRHRKTLDNANRKLKAVESIFQK